MASASAFQASTGYWDSLWVFRVAPAFWTTYLNPHGHSIGTAGLRI
jgi:hypothetical protein